MNKWRLLDEVYFFIRDYPTNTTSLPAVCRELMQYMKEGGSVAELVDDTHRDFKTVQIDDHRFRIIRHKGWTRYDVIPID